MIKIIAVGKIKEKYLSMAIDEYLKKLSKFVKVVIEQVKDVSSKESASEKEEEKVKEIEGMEILSQIKNEYVIALDSRGEMMDSKETSSWMSSLFTNGYSDLTFVIGGSLGLSKEVLKRANYIWSFSKLTFPHQLFRVILLEQIYRSYKIMKNEPYNK